MNFLNFTVFPAETDAPLHTVFLPACRNAPQVEPLQDTVLHFLDLPMFAGQFADTGATPLSTALEHWLYYIVRRGSHRAMEDPIMKKILEESPDIADDPVIWSSQDSVVCILFTSRAHLFRELRYRLHRIIAFPDMVKLVCPPT